MDFEVLAAAIPVVIIVAMITALKITLKKIAA